MSSVRRARRVLARDGLRARLPAPPTLPVEAYAGVLAVLRRVRATCLEQAAVDQAWWMAHGHPLDIVVGVRKDRDEFLAHAWVDWEGSLEGAGYREIRRIPPQAAVGSGSGPDRVDGLEER